MRLKSQCEEFRASKFLPFVVNGYSSDNSKDSTCKCHFRSESDLNIRVHLLMLKT